MFDLIAQNPVGAFYGALAIIAALLLCAMMVCYHLDNRPYQRKRRVRRTR